MTKLSFLGLVLLVGSANAAMLAGSPYISSGGTLLVLEFDEVLNEGSVPGTQEFRVDEVMDGVFIPVAVSGVDVVRDKVILKLGKPIQAVDADNGQAVKVEVGYKEGGGLQNQAGVAVASFLADADNNSTNFPMSISFSDQDAGAKCGAWKIEMDGTTGGVTVFSTYCADSMPVSSPDSGALVFSETNALGSTNPAYCGSFDSFDVDGSGHVRITTTDDCVVDRDADGIPGVDDAAPDAPARDVCVEEAHGEVNLANTSATSCSGVVSVVTGNGVTVDSETTFAAGEFIRLLPGFSVVQGAQFTARTGEFL